MATYTISTLDQLQEMGSHLTDECVLANDIDASETSSWNYGDGVYQGFVPVGSEASPFQGSFDGGGFTIRGLYINRDYSSPHLGLFGFIKSQDQKITNGTFTGAATSWTLGTGWAYNSDNVIKNADGTGTLSQLSAVMATPIVAGETYTLKYTISGWSVGTVTASCGGETLSARSGNGAYEEEFTASVSADPLVFTPTDTSRFTLDTVTLYRKHTFTDVKILDATIIGRPTSGVGGSDCGIFVGDTNGESSNHLIISNIDVSGRIYTYYLSTGSSNSGGFASSLGYTDVDSCSADVAQFCETYSGGFIGGCSGCQISNCRASGSVIRSGLTLSGYGGISGFVHSVGGGTSGRNYFDNCSASVGLIDLSQYVGSQSSNIGGFCGQARTATFTECIAYCNIVKAYAGYAYIGGFYGTTSTASSPDVDFYRCATLGAISWKVPHSSAYTSIGGFAGCYSASGSPDMFEDCYAIVDICESGFTPPTDFRVGGFVGTLAGSATRCYSAGYVPSLTKHYMGGFIGYKYSGSTTDCFFDTEEAGTTDGVGTGSETGVTGKTTAEMKVQATFTNFDFDDVWEITTFEQPARAQTNLTVWMSQVDDYDNFEEGTNDNEAIVALVPSTNEIRWISSLESLLVGTSGDEWRVGSNKLDTVITPMNYKVEQQTEHGSSVVQPLRINASVVYVDYVGRKLREMTFTGEKYESPDLTSLAEHITYSGVTTIARQKNPDSTVWATLADGSLVSMVYEREQGVVAWSKHPVGGTDVSVESVCVIPGATEDEVYIAVSRTIDSATAIYLEKLAPRVFTDLDDAIFVDSSITFETATAKTISAFTNYTATVAGTTQVTVTTAHTLTTGQEVIITGTTNYNGTYTATVIDDTKIRITKAYVADDATGSLYIPVTAITGLSHLEGETVQVLGDSVVLDEEVVASGAITASVAVLKAQVGLPYEYILQPMRITVGTDDGSALGSMINVNELVVSFYNADSVSYATSHTTSSDNDLEIDFNDERWVNNSTIDGLFTGEVVVSMQGGFSPLTPIIITGSNPLPCTVRCIVPRILKTGR